MPSTHTGKLFLKKTPAISFSDEDEDESTKNQSLAISIIVLNKTDWLIKKLIAKLY